MRLTGWSGQPRSITLTRTSILWLMLNLTDLALTLIIIQQGLGCEGNPLLQLLPLPNMIIFKLGLALLVAVILGNKRNIMRGLNIGMFLVVMWNLSCLINPYEW